MIIIYPVLYFLDSEVKLEFLLSNRDQSYPSHYIKYCLLRPPCFYVQGHEMVVKVEKRCLPCKEAFMLNFRKLMTYSHVLGQYDSLPELLVQLDLVVLELFAQLLPVTRDLHQMTPLSVRHVTLTQRDRGLTFRLDRKHGETVWSVDLLGEIQGRRARLERGEGRLEQRGRQLLTSVSCLNVTKHMLFSRFSTRNEPKHLFNKIYFSNGFNP